jgi:hypothetical protein
MSILNLRRGYFGLSSGQMLDFWRDELHHISFSKGSDESEIKGAASIVAGRQEVVEVAHLPAAGALKPEALECVGVRRRVSHRQLGHHRHHRHHVLHSEEVLVLQHQTVRLLPLLFRLPPRNQPHLRQHGGLHGDEDGEAPNRQVHPRVEGLGQVQSDLTIGIVPSYELDGLSFEVGPDGNVELVQQHLPLVGPVEEGSADVLAKEGREH